MRKDITVAAEPRAARGKNEARRLRVRALSPAVVYGNGKDALAVALDPKDLEKIIFSPSGRNTVFNLDVQDTEKTPAMIVATQRDPIKSHLLHADLLRIDLTKELTVEVPVHLHGAPKGVKNQGGTMEVVTRSISITVLPEEIPAHFDIDIAELALHESVRASDVPLTGSMKLACPADQVIVHIVGQKVEEAPAEGATEPEVAKKGKKDAPAKGAAPAKAAAPAKKK